MPKKSLGQNFLRNKAGIRAIVEAVQPGIGETIVEIGPGHGELTSEIADRKPKIIAIEKDEQLSEALKKLGIENLEIKNGDALEILPKLVSEFRKQGISNCKIVGNIPYYITGHLLRVISELPEDEKPTRCVFTIQKEVAERIVALPPSMNRLAASVAYWADAKIVTNLPKEDFWPTPKVASAVILLNRKKYPAFPDPTRYYAAVRAVFSQPRKTILNNIASALGSKKKEDVSRALQNIGILPESRPQDLATSDIANIAETFF